MIRGLECGSVQVPKEGLSGGEYGGGRSTKKTKPVLSVIAIWRDSLQKSIQSTTSGHGLIIVPARPVFYLLQGDAMSNDHGIGSNSVLKTSFSSSSSTD